MRKSLEDNLDELLGAGVIDNPTAVRIRQYFEEHSESSSQRQILVFSVLGALLVGLGIILIIAHNWDQLSRATKSFFAFLPLIIGQAFAFYAYLKKEYSPAWKEASATFLILSIGACIALISQIYNIPGSMTAFLLTWTLLTFPLIYLLDSTIAAVLFITGITWYACDVSYWTYPTDFPWFYWIQLIAVLPFYVKMIRKMPYSNFTALLHWCIPLSLVVSLGTFAEGYAEFILTAYVALFSLLFLIGEIQLLNQRRLYFNSYRIIGSVGILVMFMVFTFQEPWRELALLEEFRFYSQELWLTVIISTMAAGFIFYLYKLNDSLPKNLTAYAFVAFIFGFILSQAHPLNAVILINIFLLAHGVSLVLYGSKRQQLDVLNYGLLIITALILCRFFDVKISFIIRGLLFLIVGASFFLFNYRILKKKKAS